MEELLSQFVKLSTTSEICLNYSLTTFCYLESIFLNFVSSWDLHRFLLLMPNNNNFHEVTISYI